MTSFFLLLTGLVFLIFHYDDNFHVVIASQVYRSAELNHDELIEKIEKYHIQSVINLRGENESDDWYVTESATLNTMHTPLYNVRLSSYELPSKELLLQLIQTIESAPKPTLIHCASGADRTGLASAIVILLANGTIDEAEKQVSWRYGALRPHSAGKLFLIDYKQWLTDHHIQQSSSQILKTWLGDYTHHEPL
jgi:protein tyrosine/serine phosphatase